MRQLTKAGFKKVFREVASGAKTDRVQLRRLLDQLGAGDVVTVTRFQRYSESLTGRHSLARLRVLQCCSDSEGERGPVGSWRAARKRNPARPGSSPPQQQRGQHYGPLRQGSYQRPGSFW